MKHIKENKLAAFAIKKPVTISMILLALMVIGMIAFKSIPIEMMPTGFSPPFLGAWIPYSNANPEEIEEQIAKPLEEQVRTIPGISEVSSNSMENGCWVWVEFHSGTDMDIAYDLLRDRIERARV
ncbi:MAG: efflux RND transporter permease subunit, partial [Calditrichia bacterium]|nr:efflux RND transporter permease subunit [Calditrichia bacterium]